MFELLNHVDSYLFNIFVLKSDFFTSVKLKHKLNQMRMKKGSLHFNWIEVKI